jgi:exopolysaccharide biosynthesis protein
MQRQDKFIISSAPMLLDDYNPVGENYIDSSVSNWSSLNSEDPQRHQRQRHPRTAVALTHDNHLILFVVDGRTSISNGMSAKELTQFLVKYFNQQYALNMDGGGSTAMCVEGLGDAKTHLVNKPCDSGGRADKQRARDTHFVILEAQ